MGTLNSHSPFQLTAGLFKAFLGHVEQLWGEQKAGKELLNSEELLCWGSKAQRLHMAGPKSEYRRRLTMTSVLVDLISQNLHLLEIDSPPPFEIPSKLEAGVGWGDIYCPSDSSS